MSSGPEVDLDAAELLDQPAQAVRERDAARVDADERDRVELGVRLDDLVGDAVKGALRARLRRGAPARRRARVQQSISTPFRPHGTGLKDGATDRLAALGDVIASHAARCDCALPPGPRIARRFAGERRPSRGCRGRYGKGADAYWVWRRAGTRRRSWSSMHGLDQSELNPWNHLAWIEHLVRQGNDVIYPRYETSPAAGSPALLHSLIGTTRRSCGSAGRRCRWSIVGYSRGGRLAVELAAVDVADRRDPAAVMSVFPSSSTRGLEEVVNFKRLPHSTRLLLVTADRDSPAGAHELLRRLRARGFPAAARPRRGGPRRTARSGPTTSPRSSRDPRPSASSGRRSTG